MDFRKNTACKDHSPSRLTLLCLHLTNDLFFFVFLTENSNWLYGWKGSVKAVNIPVNRINIQILTQLIVYIRKHREEWDFIGTTDSILVTKSNSLGQYVMWQTGEKTSRGITLAGTCIRMGLYPQGTLKSPGLPECCMWLCRVHTVKRINERTTAKEPGGNSETIKTEKAGEQFLMPKIWRARNWI